MGISLIFQEPAGPITAIAYNQDSNVLALAAASNVTLWSVDTGHSKGQKRWMLMSRISLGKIAQSPSEQSENIHPNHLITRTNALSFFGVGLHYMFVGGNYGFTQVGLSRITFCTHSVVGSFSFVTDKCVA
jgi:hypothetical protein